MFNPIKPFNHLPLLPGTVNYDQIAILKAVNKANIVLAKLNAKAERLPNSFLLVSPLLVRESVASSGIENINTTVQEALEAEVLPEEKRTGAAKEALHYRDAMLYGMNIIQKKAELTINDLVNIQSMIEPEKKGIRKEQVKIINHNNKDILYTPPEPKYLQKLLQNLEDYMHHPSAEVDPLIKMAMIHYQFESIHPFLDGNGRVGRILMILYLMLVGRMNLPTLFLSGYIEVNRRSYYDHLQKAHSSKKGIAEMILFFIKGVEIQSLKTQMTIEAIEELMETFKYVVDKKMNIYTTDLIDCLFSRGFLTIDYVQKQLQLSSRQTASKYLATLVKYGLMKERKVGKGKIFYNEAFCKLLS